MQAFRKISDLLSCVLVASITCVRCETFSPRANPLPKPISIKWSNDAESSISSIYFTARDQLKIDYPRDNEVLASAIDRSLNRIYTDKWIPQALSGPAPKYRPFPLPANNSAQILFSQSNLSTSNLQTRPSEAISIQDQYGSLPQYPLGLNNHHSHTSGDTDISTIHIRIENLEAELQYGFNESYTLDVYSREINITSATVWGALHALTTLEQLVEWDTEMQQVFIERSVSVNDFPLFSYRGVMIDTARNYYSVQALLRQIDTMALAKLNVFHWHLVDTQSWPLELKTFPGMILDAYSPTEVYTQKDVEEIIHYGYMRGIRVIPEIDMPAHSNSGWNQVNPEIVACGDSFWNGYGDNWDFHTASQPTPGHLDILHPQTLPIVEKVYEEVSSVFRDDFFHVGLDEIVPNCYNYSHHVSEWFRENSTRTYRDLIQLWIDMTLPVFLQDRPNRRIIMWEDALLSKQAGAHDLPQSSVVLQSWMGGKKNIRELLKRGYDVIVSSADFFYLDCGAGGFVTNDPSYNVQTDPMPGKHSFNYQGPGGSWCAPYKTWQRIYSYDFTYDTPEEPLSYNSSQILGASVALWSEQSDDNVVDQKLWPRAAALAELLWSGNRDANGNKRTSEFAQRIINFRERLVKTRGIMAEVLVPKYCVSRPHSCDLFMNQSIIS